MLKKLIISFIVIFFGFSNLVYSENLQFGSSNYIGDVKKGKAHGKGILNFSDGSVYEGTFKKNKIHGKGKFIDKSGTVFEGKFRYGKFIKKINNNTRQVLKLNPKTGADFHFEIKGQGQVSTKWFEAEKNSSGEFQYTARGKRDMDIAASEAVGNSGSSAGACGG
tara:strand:+ start:112 stop:606 length:495 start_codon:yes stop_codon:yes gene_type:complete